MNVKLANEVLKHIQNLPKGDKWDQSEFFYAKGCGTACCFAGWAVALKCDFKGSDLNSYLKNLDIDQAAIKLLRITPDQAEELFSESNQLVDLERLVKELS